MNRSAQLVLWMAGIVIALTATQRAMADGGVGGAGNLNRRLALHLARRALNRPVLTPPPPQLRIHTYGYTPASSLVRTSQTLVQPILIPVAPTALPPRGLSTAIPNWLLTHRALVNPSIPTTETTTISVLPALVPYPQYPYSIGLR